MGESPMVTQASVVTNKKRGFAQVSFSESPTGELLEIDQTPLSPEKERKLFEN